MSDSGVVIVLVIALFAFVLVYLQHQWQVERRELLNRIMSRDYSQYAAVESDSQRVSVPVNVVTVDDLKKEIDVERERHSGIPV